LIVVGLYRLFIFKKGFGGKIVIAGKKRHSNLPLLDLEKLLREDDNTVRLAFKKEFAISLRTPRVKELVSTIYSSFLFITAGHQPLTLDIPPDWQVQNIPTENTSSVAEGWLNTYEALCNYFLKPARRMYHRFIEDLCAQNRTDLALNECPGMEPKSNVAVDFATAILAAQYNFHFDSVVLKNVQQKEALTYFGVVMQTNTRIALVILSNLEANDISVLGNALAQNKLNVLQVIDVSGNPIDRSFPVFAASLVTFTHGLSILNLENCKLSSRSLVSLFDAFVRHLPLSASIEELYLGGNAFDSVAISAFLTWIDIIRGHSALRCVSVANTNMDLLRFGRSMSFMVTVETIDISGNRMEELHYTTLCEMVFASQALKVLKMANCRLTPRAVEFIASAFTRNQYLSQVEWDLSCNDLGPTGALTLARALKGSNFLKKLNLADNKLKSKGILTLLDVLGSGVEELILDQNLSYSDDADTVCQRLSEFVNAPTNNVVKLCVAGGPKGPFMRQRILPLLVALRSNQTVTELDVSWNQMGDAGMAELAEVLYSNRSLLSLKIDGNFFGIGGLQAFLRALRQNTVLLNIPTPHIDLDRLEKDQKDEAHRLWQDIVVLLRANMDRNADRSSGRRLFGQPEPKPATPQSVKPLSELPPHLMKGNQHQRFQTMVNEATQQQQQQQQQQQGLPLSGSSPRTTNRPPIHRNDVSPSDYNEEEHNLDADVNIDVAPTYIPPPPVPVIGSYDSEYSDQTNVVPSDEAAEYPVVHSSSNNTNVDQEESDAVSRREEGADDDMEIANSEDTSSSGVVVASQNQPSQFKLSGLGGDNRSGPSKKIMPHAATLRYVGRNNSIGVGEPPQPPPRKGASYKNLTLSAPKKFPSSTARWYRGPEKNLAPSGSSGNSESKFSGNATNHQSTESTSSQHSSFGASSFSASSVVTLADLGVALRAPPPPPPKRPGVAPKTGLKQPTLKSEL